MLDSEKIIWSYWHDPQDIPYIVELAVKSWKKSNPDYTINFLNQTNFTEFVDINELPPIFNNLRPVEQSDVMRLYLLAKYGGIWIDSSILVTQSLSIIWDNQYDIGGYWLPGFTTNNEKKVFESWFISAPKEGKFIRAWKNEFYRALTDYKTRKHYISDIESKGVDLQNIGDMKEYLLIHCCYLKVIHDDANYNIKVFSATDDNGPLQWLSDNNWYVVVACIKVSLFSTAKVPSLIKFRSCDRIILRFLIDYSLYSSKSLIGQIIHTL